MLAKTSKSRYSVEQALSDPWLRSFGATSPLAFRQHGSKAPCSFMATFSSSQAPRLAPTPILASPYSRLCQQPEASFPFPSHLACQPEPGTAPPLLVVLGQQPHNTVVTTEAVPAEAISSPKTDFSGIPSSTAQVKAGPVKAPLAKAARLARATSPPFVVPTRTLRSKSFQPVPNANFSVSSTMNKPPAKAVLSPRKTRAAAKVGSLPVSVQLGQQPQLFSKPLPTPPSPAKAVLSPRRTRAASKVAAPPPSHLPPTQAGQQSKLSSKPHIHKHTGKSAVCLCGFPLKYMFVFRMFVEFLDSVS